MANFKDEAKLQSELSNHKRKCSCGHSATMPPTYKKDYAICTWCGKKIFKDIEKQKEHDKKVKQEEFRIRMWKTIAEIKSERKYA